MSSNNASGKVVTVDEQAFEKAGGQAVDEDGFPVVDETPEFEAAVEQETQAKVDANHPDGIADTSNERIHGVTLEQEERIRAREAELERISAQAELGTQDGREKRTREIAAKRSAERRAEFQKRAASVNPMADPERGDPRAELTQEQLAAVNKQSMRLAKKLDGWSRAAIGRRLGEAVVGGKDLMSAVVGVFEELQTAPGQVVPIGKLEDVNRKEVSIEGRVTQLWDPSHPSIAQVGLITDDSGQTRVTIWEKSDAPLIEEGEQVRIHGAARNWYEGRVSLAVTGWSTLHFPERGRWWEE
ncbi:OB-fold nucleic acid binding domain protein [Haloferax gibbonsii ATCC 33959]|uniref:OB-fold nucleic acid binding domain protein n=1 Tax=Haloferax gibbonsii (strain ATCC 33959 / DSM 4427 / JCM 8863 / NBRC 102184 / NCIMB 2188 / Ma 2.38) TaxID=1227459 RepID=M0HTE2_HALGM|nr:OB-fold nucleic acid binding domain-containing protein [Haloferax gibbonsii]ELZ86957.1 OB-fold nucleic acid binding domain protein [Haloferax gibbonsii ATCC 33959]